MFTALFKSFQKVLFSFIWSVWVIIQPDRPACLHDAVFTARCTIVQSAVLRSQVVPSVCPSLC